LARGKREWASANRFISDNAVPDPVSSPVNGVFPNLPSGLVILTY